LGWRDTPHQPDVIILDPFAVVMYLRSAIQCIGTVHMSTSIEILTFGILSITEIVLLTISISEDIIAKKVNKDNGHSPNGTKLDWRKD
jgi:hypothetical protein